MITDIERHNEEQAAVWKAFHEGSPIRVPVTLGVSMRYTLANPEANRGDYTFREYFLDPDVMFEMQLQQQHWLRFHLPRDAEMGLPQQWTANVDFQNSYEAGWFGCEMVYPEGQPPDTIPLLADDERKWALIDCGIPDPFADGWMERNWEYYEHLQQCAEGFEFHGRPVVVGSPTGVGTDGPFTVACNLRGATEVCLDLREDPAYFQELMEYITEATIVRIKAYRERLGQPVETKAWGFADDSIQLLSAADYRERVLPYHRQLIDTFGPEGPNSIHLCGDATRHFRTLRDELNVMSFDTGFPVDFGALRTELGPEVTINGGPHVELLRTGAPAEVKARCREILASGIMEGGKFILREGNNLAPGTPEENVAAMYEAAREYGTYG